MKKTFKNNLYFLRHCTTDSNNNDIISGTSDVHICRNSLLDFSEISSFVNLCIVSSPLLRCRETVKILFEYTKRDFPVFYSQYLIERSMGFFEGMKRKTASYTFSNYFKQEHFIYYLTPPEGESFTDLSKRVDLFINDFLMELLKEKDVLICSHNQVMKMIYIKLNNIEIEQNWNTIHFKNGKVYQIK